MFECNRGSESVQASKSLPRYDKYTCPSCLDELLLCVGEKNQPHFRHINHTACVYTNVAPEPIEPSDEVAQLKEQLRLATIRQKRARLLLELAQVEQQLTD